MLNCDCCNFPANEDIILGITKVFIEFGNRIYAVAGFIN